LLVNGNYDYSINWISNLVNKFEKVYVIANYRAVLSEFLSKATHLKIPDNLFSNYIIEKDKMFKILNKMPSNCLILSSASSFSNILGCHVHRMNRKITFIDIGTSLNRQLGLSLHHRTYSNPSLPRIKRIFMKKKLKW
jgi:hypothetical protein